MFVHVSVGLYGYGYVNEQKWWFLKGKREELSPKLRFLTFKLINKADQWCLCQYISWNGSKWTFIFKLTIKLDGIKACTLYENAAVHALQ